MTPLDRSAPARDKVLFQLKTRGPQTPADVAKRLQITEVAVRQHLRRLEEEGLVEEVDQKRSVGRPARIFAVTASAAERFPNTHADLTVDIIGAVRDTFGEEGLRKLIEKRSRRQLRAYRERLAKATTLEAKVALAAEIRAEEGYMADWSRAADGSFLLVENHCPICIAAKACQGLCRDELSVFQSLFGKDVRVERTEHLLAGARRCAYRIAPKSTPLTA